MNIYSNLDLYKELDIVCNDEILGKDHTLKFILVTKWKDKEQPMRLNFRPKMIF
jgi:polycomb group RING finger protein 3